MISHTPSNSYNKLSSESTPSGFVGKFGKKDFVVKREITREREREKEKSLEK